MIFLLICVTLFLCSENSWWNDGWSVIFYVSISRSKITYRTTRTQA